MSDVLFLVLVIIWYSFTNPKIAPCQLLILNKLSSSHTLVTLHFVEPTVYAMIQQPPLLEFRAGCGSTGVVSGSEILLDSAWSTVGCVTLLKGMLSVDSRHTATSAVDKVSSSACEVWANCSSCSSSVTLSFPWTGRTVLDTCTLSEPPRVLSWDRLLYTGSLLVPLGFTMLPDPIHFGNFLDELTLSEWPRTMLTGLMTIWRIGDTRRFNELIFVSGSSLDPKCKSWICDMYTGWLLSSFSGMIFVQHVYM